ncbi:MAG: YdcF family protein, partial [Oscillospiraceae bacterium]|nr:YdcF family protein [Oscillospiraceae bacterium]
MVQKTDSRITDTLDAGYDCILILGAGVREDGTPSFMLRDRLERGLELYKAGVSGKIIVSGDHGTKGYDEVNVMKNYLIDA